MPGDWTWDKKSLVVDVVAQGEIADVLLAVQDTECLANLMTEANDEERSLAASVSDTCKMQDSALHLLFSSKKRFVIMFGSSSSGISHTLCPQDDDHVWLK